MCDADNVWPVSILMPALYYNFFKYIVALCPAGLLPQHAPSPEVQCAGPGLQCVGPGLQCVGPGLQCVGQGLQCAEQGESFPLLYEPLIQ